MKPLNKGHRQDWRHSPVCAGDILDKGPTINESNRAMMNWAADKATSQADGRNAADPSAHAVRTPLLEEWQQRIASADEAAEFPADRSRPAVLGHRSHRARRSIPQLAQTTQQPIDTLIAAWAIFFAKAVGTAGSTNTVVVAEHQGDHEKGFLLNVDLDRHDSVRRLVSAIAEARRAEAERGPVVFAALADALGLADRADRNTLCSTAVGPSGRHETGVDNSLTMPDLQLEWGGTSACASACASTGASAGSGTISLNSVEIIASAALFAPRRVERIADQFLTLLHSVTTAPDQSPSDVDWVPDQEIEMFESWQGPRLRPHDPLLGRRFAELVPQWPERCAVSFNDSEWTYAQLDAWSNRLASELRRRGVGNDSVVAIRMDRSIELIGSIVAVLKAGGAYLPVDPAYPPARQRYMLDHGTVSVILSDRSNTRAGTHADDAMTIVVDDPHADFHGALDEPVAPKGDGSELGYVIFTSGSTGKPKAVGLPIRALANLMDWQLAQPEFEFGRRTLQFSSPSFDVSFQEIMSTLLSGGTLVLIDDTVRRDPRGMYRHIIEHDVERIFLPNVALRGLAEVAANRETNGDLTLREVYTAGEQLRVDDVMRSLFEQLPGCRLVNQYGPSETHVSTAHVLGDDVAEWPVLPPIGAPIANTVAEVLDPSCRRVPVGIPGELWLGGRCLARGYVGDLEATAERFLPDPFRPGETLYRTGDHVKWSDDGELEFLGRLDHQVKYRGFRIEPAEIAAVLSAVDGVGQCFVAVRDVAGAGARLVAYVQVADPTLEMSDLRHRAAETLPDYMVPTHFVQMDTIPLTSSGKVDLESMPTPKFDRGVLDSEFVAPRNQVEEAIQSMWQSLLGADKIGVIDDFYELGGDSLMAVELFAMIDERFGVELPLGVLAQHPTIKGLADQVTRAGVGADDFDVIVPIRTGGSRTSLFCVHGGSGNVASFPRLARMLDPDQPFYGLQWPGLRFGRFPRSMSALAEHYIEEIQRVQPNGPYRLAGQCIGGLIAHEMARQLIEAGQSVDFVVLYDSPMLYSPAYHPKASLPAIPSFLRPLALRSLSAAVGLVRFVKGRWPRADLVKTRARRLLRLRVPRDQLFIHGASVMCGLAWRHQPPTVDGVRTVLIHSGLENAGSMALTGRWDDGTLGWRHRIGPSFEAHQVSGSHNELLYSAASVAVLKGLLGDEAL